MITVVTRRNTEIQIGDVRVQTDPALLDYFRATAVHVIGLDYGRLL